MIETILSYSITAIFAYLALRLAIDLIQRTVSCIYRFIRRKTIRIRFNAYKYPYLLRHALRNFVGSVVGSVVSGFKRAAWCLAWPFAKLLIALLPAPKLERPAVVLQTRDFANSMDNINPVLEKPTFLRQGKIL